MTVVREYLEAHNAHDASAVGALYAEGGTHREVATGQQKTGAGDIAAGLATFLTAFPDARWAHGAPVSDRGRTAVPYRLTGTLREQLGPFAPNGQQLDLEGLVLIEVGDEGITTTTDYWDAATFARQMNASQRSNT